MMEAGALSPAHFALALAIMALAGLVHGALGLGFPLVATPLLALITDMKTAIVFTWLPTFTVILLSIAKGGRPAETVVRFWALPLYMIVGSYLGARLLIVSDPAPFGLLLGLLVLAYLNLDRLRSLAGRWIEEHARLTRAVFGLMAGLFESTANVAGPVLLIYFLSLGLAPAVLVQALNFCFFAGKSTQGVTLALAGGVAPAVWLSTVPFAAAGAAALFGGIALRNRISAETYRRWLRGALWVIAVLLIGQFAWRSVH